MGRPERRPYRGKRVRPPICRDGGDHRSRGGSSGGRDHQRASRLHPPKRTDAPASLNDGARSRMRRLRPQVDAFSFSGPAHTAVGSERRASGGPVPPERGPRLEVCRAGRQPSFPHSWRCGLRARGRASSASPTSNPAAGGRPHPSLPITVLETAHEAGSGFRQAVEHLEQGPGGARHGS